MKTTDRYIGKKQAYTLMELFGLDTDIVDECVANNWITSRTIYGETFVNLDDLYDFFADGQDAFEQYKDHVWTEEDEVAAVCKAELACIHAAEVAKAERRNRLAKGGDR